MGAEKHTGHVKALQAALSEVQNSLTPPKSSMSALLLTASYGDLILVGCSSGKYGTLLSSSVARLIVPLA